MAKSAVGVKETKLRELRAAADEAAERSAAKKKGGKGGKKKPKPYGR